MRTPATLLAALTLAATLFAAEPPPPSATEQWEPVPPVVTVEAGRPPSDAVVLFDGTNLSAWKADESRPGWKVEDGALVVVPGGGYLRTAEAFGDVQLHLEYRSPVAIEGSGQGRGNSGVFLMGRYEVQVLDSWENATYVNGQAASIYKQSPPLVNASRPPGQWQSLDIIFRAPRFGPTGSLISPARITVLHNGVLVQDNFEIRGTTTYRGEPRYEPHAAEAPISLQDHGDLVAYRNIWARRLSPR